MKYPKRDKVFRDLLNLTATQTKIPIADVERSIEFYLKNVSQIIEWDNPVTIHIDYIGNLIFNQKYKNKMEEVNGRSSTT